MAAMVEFKGKVYIIPLEIEAKGAVALEEYCRQEIPGYAAWRDRSPEKAKKAPEAEKEN